VVLQSFASRVGVLLDFEPGRMAFFAPTEVVSADPLLLPLEAPRCPASEPAPCRTSHPSSAPAEAATSRLERRIDSDPREPPEPEGDTDARARPRALPSAVEYKSVSVRDSVSVTSVSVTPDALGGAFVEDAIRRSLPDAVQSDDPGRCLFELARRVKPLVASDDSPLVRECYDRWHDLAERTSRDIWLECINRYDEFLHKLRSIRTAHGEQWNAVVAHSCSVAVPAQIQGGRLEAVARIMIALAELEANEHQVFFIGFRRLGDACGLYFRTASRHVRALGGLGFVELVEAGDVGLHPGAKANRYRWHNPPIAGGAPWNSKKKP
jgi:hypothetical protein